MDFDKIIVLDDEWIIRKTLEEQLRKRRYVVATASCLSEAEKLLSKDQFDLLFVDVRLPDGEGIELLERLSKLPESPMVVMMTGYGSIKSAVECMRLGAFDYIMKPFSIDEIDIVLKKAKQFNQLVKVNHYLSNEAQDSKSLLGNSIAMVALKNMIQKVAATEATVLITGENGTGKELVAHELFRLSNLSKQNFIKVNCAAISETLIESEFFGHEKGAFTGAMQRRIGRFELANGGTILLDEIGEISLHVQSKLLRVLQEREFERVGGNKTIQTKVRILATTNRNLLKAVEKGDFREDLYYRLNVFPITVPPLRDRKEDILVLAEHFVQFFSRKHGIQVKGLSEESREVLLHHNWPGNVRELQNTLERSIILSEPGSFIKPHALGIVVPIKSGSSVEESMLSQKGAAQKSQITSDAKEQGFEDCSTDHRDYLENRFQGDHDHENALKKNFPNQWKKSVQAHSSLEDVERNHILSTLEKTQGNHKEAATILKISVRTLRNKLNQYGFSCKSETEEEFSTASALN